MHELTTNIASRLGLPVNIVLAAAGIICLLAAGSIARWVQMRNAPPDERSERLGSLLVWWGMALIVGCFLVLGKVAAAVVLAGVSWIGLTEFFAMLDRKAIDATGRWILLAWVPIVYASVFIAEPLHYLLICQMLLMMAITVRLVLAGKTEGFVQAAAAMLWGGVVVIFCVAHLALILTVPESSNPVGGSAGWLLFLIVFTECSDIFQALWGRRYGRNRITPRVSPKKTWEGFIGGGLTAIAIGFALAPFLTPFAEPWTLKMGSASWRIPYLGALVAGIVLWLVGFFGDLNISAIKRDAGVKDTGTCLPSQGGILDRIDSLTFTAPVFYYFIRFFYD